MRLQRLSIFNFRNYKEAKINFSDGINILYGENGAGKTSILEAVHYLALTKSFRSTNDRHLIFHDEKMLRLQGEFKTAQGEAWSCHLAYSLSEGKRLIVNGQKIIRFSDYIGEIPIVLLSPSDLQLSQGDPRSRRRFLDILLSQSSNLYLHHLLRYRRSLKQRNSLLQSSQPTMKLLVSWEENLIKDGIEIIRKRIATVEQLSEMVKQFYRALSRREDKVRILYRCNVVGQQFTDLIQNYRNRFAEKRAKERETGSTLVGPHRDDLLFLINGNPMKTYASQGEHKTFIIALKLAEFKFLQQQRHQPPILLFDDIFGELDARRIRLMLEQLGNIGQVFATTTSKNFFEKIQNFPSPTHYYFVDSGTITEQVT